MVRSTLIAAAFAAGAFAMPQITSPAAGSSNPISGTSGSVTVEWKDDGEAPKISELKSFTLQLIVGGNTDTDSLPITAGESTAFGSATSTKFTISSTMADEVQNGFYFKMMSVATEGGQVITYSKRFSLSGMTGTTAPQYVTAAKNAGTAVPENQDQTANNADAGSPANAANPNSGIPLASQTGLMRYAPMQSVPPTKITKKETKPLYPTSAYKVATTFLPTPSVTKTETASQTFSADSMENTASPLPGPDGDMRRFMNRWKD
ncbi:hypothetical protein WHR41_00884 [Cladosporium halotolerans]|uniref:Uncharacterized protein n=1 Tax=Cladosporium halotolerans TaxID=1052096 RepID=A0AB34L0W2_9PEZI